MSEHLAGWYPDPSGDASKLRYWDGTRWTDHYTDAQQGTLPVPPFGQPYAQSASGPQATMPENAYASASGQQTGGQAYSQDSAQTSPQGYSEASTQGRYQGYAQTSPQGYTQAYAYTYTQTPQQTYYQDSSSQTMRMVAFVLNLLSTIAFGILIIPLAWMIPMTVHSWGLYKGTERNTIAFGVCTLLFLNLISGILLLISGEDQ